MKIKAEVNEAKEVKEAEDENHRVAAFFDLDGTLMPLPSLERRLFRMLRYRGEIPLKNYLCWLREAMQLLPRGITGVAHANKMYLRDVQTFDESGRENAPNSPMHKSGHRGEGQASMPPRHNPRLPVPCFFEKAVERMECHAMLGHSIVIVSGTLEPLAKAMARVLEGELAARGFATRIRVCATRLEESKGRWTGRILGEVMFGEEKARAVEKIAEEMELDLAQCWAYGDSAADRWMLQAVGHPTAVNPTVGLAQIARERDWAVLRWSGKRSQTMRRHEHREEESKCMAESEHEFVLKHAEPLA